MLEEIEALLNASQIACFDGDPGTGRAGYARAAQMALEANLPELRARALRLLAEMDVRDGRHAEALAGLEAAAAMYRRTGNAPALAYAIRARAEVFYGLKRWLEAGIAWREAREIFARLEQEARNDPAQPGRKARRDPAHLEMRRNVNECDSRLREIDQRIQKEIQARRRRTPDEVLKSGRGIWLGRGRPNKPKRPK